jgi:CRISPR-associated protein Cas5h
MGIVGAILGKPRDSYYEDFSSDKLRFGIQVKTNIKKVFHRVNYLMIKDHHDLRGRRQHVQTPVELISGNDVSKDSVRYRIYVSYHGSENSVFQELKKALVSSEVSYSITLGTANHTASLENVYLFDENNINEIDVNHEFISLHSACNSVNVEELNFNKEDPTRVNFIEEELMPADFKANYDREVVKMNRVIYTIGDMPLQVKLSGLIYQLTDKNGSVNIQFLE